MYQKKLKSSKYLHKAMEHPNEGQNLGSFLAAKAEKFRNLLSQQTQTNRICHGTRVDFVLENINNKYSTEMLSPEVTDHMQQSHSYRRKFHG
jgi:hypothetical protein